MKKLIYLAAVAAIFGACTSSKEIPVASNVTIEIDARPVIDEFAAWQKGELDMYEGSSLGIYCFVYDMDGNLVEKGEGMLDDYSISSWTLEGMQDGEYQIVAVSYASVDEYSAYEINGSSRLETLEIYQNFYQSLYTNLSCLGMAFNKITIGEDDVIKISMEPACAYVEVTYRNMIHIDDSRVDGVSFWMKANRFVEFKDDAPYYTNELGVDTYYVSSVDMPSGTYSGIREAFFLLPSDDMYYQASYNMGEEVLLEFGKASTSIVAGEQYEFVVDCPNQTISVQTRATSASSSEYVGKNTGTLNVSEYYGITK